MDNPCDRCADRGMCCRYIQLPLARSLTADEGAWVELHPGVHMVTADTIHITTNCSALTEDGMCSLFGTDLRPEMCAVWPDNPREQAPAGCAFLEV